jgi:hypothetical protein
VLAERSTVGLSAVDRRSLAMTRGWFDLDVTVFLPELLDVPVRPV